MPTIKTKLLESNSSPYRQAMEAYLAKQTLERHQREHMTHDESLELLPLTFQPLDDGRIEVIAPGFGPIGRVATGETVLIQDLIDRQDPYRSLLFIPTEEQPSSYPLWIYEQE